MTFHAEDLTSRAVASLVCHAIGDAMGAPAENLDPASIRARWGWIDSFVVDDPGSTDDTEYSLLSARLLLEHGLELTPAAVAAAWRTHLADQAGGFAGAGFSEMAAIENLRRGLEPPASAQHVHAWSDGAAMRAAPAGIRAAGDPDLAAALVTVDAGVSHGREGVAGARAIAAGVAEALRLPVPSAEDAAARARRIAGRAADAAGEGWTATSIRRAIEIATEAPDLAVATEQLHAELVVGSYYWADLAPEAVGLAFGVYVAAEGRPRAAILGGVNVGRDADTIAAMAGALAGATHGLEDIPEGWRRVVARARGACIAAVAGWSVEEAATDLAAARIADLDDARTAEVRGEAGTPARPDAPARASEPDAPSVGIVLPAGGRSTTAGASVTSGVLGGARSEDGPVGDRSRARGALLGMAVAEATSWTAHLAHAHELPAWRRQMFDQIRDRELAAGIVRPVVPFTMNEPSAELWPAAGEATEWAVWVARRQDHSRAAVLADWREVARTGARGSYSVQAALSALRRGVEPPATGHHNPHAVDDAAALRACGIVAAARDPRQALPAVALDAAVTSVDDGLDAALVVAAMAATAIVTGALDEVVAAGRAQAVPGGWTARLLDEALAAVEGREPLEAALALATEVPSYLYSHAVAAPETVALATGLVVAARGDFAAATPAAALLPRFAPGVPALVGALTGALGGVDSLPSGWVTQVDRLRGVAVPALRGRSLSAAI